VSQRHLSALSEAWHAQLTFRNPPPPPLNAHREAAFQKCLDSICAPTILQYVSLHFVLRP
jgi:hypothetical protein